MIAKDSIQLYMYMKANNDIKFIMIKMGLDGQCRKRKIKRT